jgi:multiple sugar transport system permease protein
MSGHLTIRGKVGLAVALLLVVVWTGFPIYWMVVTAFRPNLDAFQANVQLIPARLTLENFTAVFSGSSPVLRFFLNSVIVSTLTAVLTLLVALPAGYALSRAEFRLNGPIFLGILLAQMLPLILLIVPIYALFQGLGLINTMPGLVIAFTSFTVPFAVWLMRGFVDAVPRELEDAAMVDGAGRFASLRYVVAPVLGPAMLAVAGFAFLDSWNSLLVPLALTTSIDMKTLTPGILFAFAGEFKNDWGGMMATSLVASVPVVLVFLGLQRYMREGLEGAVKG